MTTPQPPRWYCVNSRGITRLCGSKEDAEHRAKLDDIDFSRYAPHRAVQLVDVSELEKERAARQEAQQRIADLQAQLVRADAERCATVESKRCATRWIGAAPTPLPLSLSAT